MGVYWNEDVVVWRRGGEECRMKFDVVVGSRQQGELVPSLIVEAKVDLDAPRLKTLMLNSLLVKRVYETKVLLVYVWWNASWIWRKIALEVLDGVYGFNLEESQVDAFIRDVIEALRASR